MIASSLYAEIRHNTVTTLHDDIRLVAVVLGNGLRELQNRHEVNRLVSYLGPTMNCRPCEKFRLKLQ